MNRASLLVASTLLASASVAFADEYTVAGFAGGYVAPPAVPAAGDPNPQSVQVILEKNVDDQTVQAALPFSFPFFGMVYDTISVSDDGWLAFGTTSVVQHANPTIPSTDAPNAVVAALWDRLATRKGDVVTFLKQGAVAAPNRVFVVAWQHVNTSDALAADDLSFEVLLHEGTGVIEIAYSTAKSGVWKKLSYTAGIENETGTRGFGGPSTTNTNLGRPAQDQRFTPNVVTVTGTITRDRPVATETGLGPAVETDIPVVGADVVLVREDKFDATAVVAKGRTDANGAFSLNAYGIDGSPTLAVDLLCSGAESRVTNAADATYTRRIASGVAPVGSPVVPLVHLDASIDALDATFRPALNIQQAARKGYAFVQAAFDASGKDQIAVRKQFPQLDIRWIPQSATPSGYSPASSSTVAIATISDDPKNPDAYDDDVVLREYAQHLLATMATFAGKLTAHVWVTPVTVPPALPATPATPQAAFLDGFSFWFAAAVQGRPHFIDTMLDATTSAPTATVFDLEGPNPAALGPQNAGSVAATLWDLVDPANEPTDEFEGSLPDTGYAVFTTLDDRTATVDAATIPSSSAAPTIASFFEKWRPTRTAAEAVATARLFIAHQALPDDMYEPNDRAGEEPALVAPKTTDLVLNESNTDRFSFALGAAPLSIAVAFADAAQADVTIVDMSDPPQTIATAPTTTSPIVVTTPEGQSAGTYVVQIAWKSGTSAHYSISQFTPPSLATPLPAKWTVGLAFNQTLTLAGGVPPGTFTLASGSVPGLSIQSAGTRFVGTPTAAGSFPLTLSVTDASGAGPQLLAPFTIEIREGLTLPSVFGVAAGKPVSVDLGRGGVAPTWTKTADTAPAGFTVTDGATLHLDGPAVGPTAFTVSASAVDPAPLNASMATKTSQVVVADAFDKARLSPPAAGKPFGFWFDAIAGSRVNLSMRFSGANAPMFLTLVDDRGAPVQLGDDVLAITASSVRIRNLVAPRTARYFIVFDASPDFSGKVAGASLRVRPPLRSSGVANIASTSSMVETRFTAIAGSRATITLRGGQVPKRPKPGAVALEAPDGSSVSLPSVRIGEGGNRETFLGVTLPQSGEYVMRMGVDGTTTGPVVFEVVIVPPKRAVFSLD
jgi:hypothetical protein